MTSEEEPTTLPGLEELRETLSNRPAADRDERRRMLYDLLARNDDPMLKEMGRQLRDGQMSLLDLANTSVYREHLFETARERYEESEDSIRTFQGENKSKPG